MKYAADGVMSFGKTFSSSNQSVQLVLFQLCTLKDNVSTRDRVVWRSVCGQASIMRVGDRNVEPTLLFLNITNVL